MGDLFCLELVQLDDVVQTLVHELHVEVLRVS